MSTVTLKISKPRFYFKTHYNGTFEDGLPTVKEIPSAYIKDIKRVFNKANN